MKPLLQHSMKLTLIQNISKKKKKFLTILNKKNFFVEKEVQILTLSKYIKKNSINKIDFIKIDTEGFEYEVLLGLKDQFDKVFMIMFEHHYDDMLYKNYKFSYFTSQN